MLSDRWVQSYPNICTLVTWASIFKLLATECYRRADATRPILFDSPHWVDSSETLPDPSRHLPAEVSPFLSLLTSITMQTLRNLYHSFPLAERIPTHSVPKLSGHWLNGYPYFYTLVHWQVFSNCWLLSATGMQTFRDIYHSIPLAGRIPMWPFPTLADICPLRDHPFSPCWPL